MNNLTYVSLFSSAGIGCYGFKQENFDCITTCELLDKRIKIQKYNHICKNSYGYITGDISKHSIKSKIFENVDKYKKENNIKDVDVILATPPCQGISVANHKKKNELRRNSLIVDSFLITKRLLPKFFVFENVQSFLKTLCEDSDGQIISIEKALYKNLLSSYFISSQVVNLKNYGSNSSRTRTLIIGTRRDLDINPADLFPDKSEPKTIRKLIYNLEKIDEFGKISSDIFHSFRPYEKKMLHWIRNIKEGQSAFENKKVSEKPHQIINGKIQLNTNKNGDKYRRNYWDKIAPCIHTRNDILASQNTIHPKENRVFSVRELMRFMSIPNTFKWSDICEKTLNNLSTNQKIKFLKKNELNIRHCIGEAVPTKVIQNIGMKISKFSKVQTMGYKNNLQAINKVIKLNHLNNFKNQERFIRNFYKKLDISYLSKIIEFSNPSRDHNAAFFTDHAIGIDVINFLPSFKGKIRILEPAVGVGNLLIPIIKKYQGLKSVEVDVFDVDLKILKLLKLLVKKQKFPKNIKVNFLNKDFLKHKFNKKYDLVLANPPFGKIKDDAKLENYKRNKICSTNTNQFVLFLEKALSISKKVGFIIPKSFISSPEYNEIRRKIEKKNINTIIDFGEFGFKGVKIETIFLFLNGNLKEKNKFNFYSYISKKYSNPMQNYVTDSKFPYWLLYRDKFFDKLAKQLHFNTFAYFRDRQITKKDTSAKGKVRVIKSRNIHEDGVKKLKGYDSYVNNYKKFQVSKFLNKKHLYLVPNLSYYPRACSLPKNAIADGSAAILIPKNGNKIEEKDLKYFSSSEYTKFYRIARNYGTRSLNIDKNSIFFWGLKKTN